MFVYRHQSEKTSEKKKQIKEFVDLCICLCLWLIIGLHSIIFNVFACCCGFFLFSSVSIRSSKNIRLLLFWFIEWRRWSYNDIAILSIYHFESIIMNVNAVEVIIELSKIVFLVVFHFAEWKSYENIFMQDDWMWIRFIISTITNLFLFLFFEFQSKCCLFVFYSKNYL